MFEHSSIRTFEKTWKSTDWAVKHPLLQEINANINKMNPICKLFGIKLPIIQGGMAWCSGWRLASAVSEAGGLGLLSAGSMTPDLLREQIRKVKSATRLPFGVNIPLMNPNAENYIKVCLEEHVKIIFTSAGNPKKWTARLKDAGVKVAHVVASARFAAKCEEAGVDAVVAEGFEAGGHNGKEELTTMCLIPAVRRVLKSTPLIAAGGIATGGAWLAAEALGADGVQIGTAFAITQESSAHDDFKRLCVTLDESSTMLSLKQLSPTRLVKNRFYEEVVEAERRGASNEEMLEMIGFGRARRGMLEGDIENGELEIGQAVALIDDIPTVAELMRRLVADHDKALSRLSPTHDHSNHSTKALVEAE